MGAPGAGVSTLGRHLAERLQIPFFDTDDFYWFTEDALRYKRKRNPEHRLKLLQEKLDPAGAWVLSGSLCGWGDALLPMFTEVWYCWQPVNVRAERILQRESARYGVERISEGGDLHVVYEKFQQWAAGYDTSTGMRGKAAEMEWLERLNCPVRHIEEKTSLDETVEWLLM